MTLVLAASFEDNLGKPASEWQTNLNFTAAWGNGIINENHTKFKIAAMDFLQIT